MLLIVGTVIIFLSLHFVQFESPVVEELQEDREIIEEEEQAITDIRLIEIYGYKYIRSMEKDTYLCEIIGDLNVQKLRKLCEELQERKKMSVTIYVLDRYNREIVRLIMTDGVLR